MPAIAFEDLVPGTVSRFGEMEVSSEAISAFASEYDPQPFHLSEDEAAGTFVGRQIASGWHTLALQMRMLADAWLLDSAGMGSPGIDAVRWRKPVLPGDVLSVRQTILDGRVSASRPWMGIVRFRFETLNARDEVVMTQENPILFGRREGPPEPMREAGRDMHPSPEPDVADSDWLGEQRFEAADIVRFARAFDPQPFHVDEEAAARSHFGRLAASGWQTTALWMRHFVGSRDAAAAAATARGEPPRRFGPSPGFDALHWLASVHAGDVVRYASTPTGRRESASRPGWAIVTSRNAGWNQTGAKVLDFESSGFVASGDA